MPDESYDEIDQLGDDDEEFKQIQERLQDAPTKGWTFEHDSENLKIYRKELNGDYQWSEFITRCVAKVPKFPKHIVLRAFSDMKIRAKWDQSLQEF